MTKTNNMEQITVTIPAQEYKSEVYINPDNCYLARALRKLLPEAEISVYCFGKTEINGIWYETKEPFDSNLLEIAFDRGQDVKVTLVKIW